MHAFSRDASGISTRLLDGSAPTVVNNKTNLHKGDVFVISLNEAGTQKLVLQVDEERAAPMASAGTPIDTNLRRRSLLSRNSNR